MLQPNVEKLDCHVRVVTPENVEFEYALAGPFQRFPAFLFDLAVRGAISFGLYFIAVICAITLPFGNLSVIVLILLFFVMYWFYGVYFETVFNGRTLGKMVFKLRVISTDGRPINGMQAALRNLLRLADTFPMPITGLVCMAITGRFQRIGDLAAGTMVIVDRPRRPLWDLQPEDPRAFGLAELIPPSFVANYTMTQTIGMYMENRRKLPMARRLEIARHLAGPLIKKFELLPDTSPDLLLTALYVRTFMSEQQQESGRDQLRQAMSKGKPTGPVRPHLSPSILATVAKVLESGQTASMPANPGNADEADVVTAVITPNASSSVPPRDSTNNASRTGESL